MAASPRSVAKRLGASPTPRRHLPAPTAFLTDDVDRLLATAVCLAHPARVHALVGLDDELLVGLVADGGRWFLPESHRADELGFAALDVATELDLAFAFPWPISRRLATRRLERWQAERTPLVAFWSVAHGRVGLTDPATGASLVANP